MSIRSTVLKAIEENWNVSDVYAAHPEEYPEIVEVVLDEEIERQAEIDMSYENAIRLEASRETERYIDFEKVFKDLRQEGFANSEIWDGIKTYMGR